jgi:hypothetical protein
MNCDSKRYCEEFYKKLKENAEKAGFDVNKTMGKLF